MFLTLRDQTLLTKLSDYGMLSTKQIANMIFSSIAKSTVLRRLRLLEQSKLVRRLSGLASTELLWSLSPLAAEKIGAMHFKRSFNKNHLEHDYKLLCLRLLFEKHGLIQSWKPEHEIRSLMAQKNNGKVDFKALVPDALMTLKCEFQTIAVAVELELTLKNKVRLKELLKRYRQKKGVHAVFYIAGHTGIINSLTSIWGSLGTANEGPRLWCLLEEELIKNPLGAKIQSSEGELSLAAFAAHSPAHRVSRDMNLEKERIERISSQNFTTMPSPMS